MKLNSLTILNFKGIKSLKLDLSGESASVYGDNATGKTSIYDAFLWLLFGKDSRGSATFSIKPIVDGEPLHNVETHVEADIVMDDGTSMNLVRKYREVWTKKRGDLTDTFSGHETVYYVDGLPVSQANYKKIVEGIMPETLFRALTNPLYFPEAMKWQDRRTQLFKLFGELTDADVAASDSRFIQLLADAGRYTVEEYTAGLKVKIRGYNTELKEIPARIDEASRQILDEDDVEAAQAAEEQISAEIRALKDAMAGEDKELTVQMAQVQREILELRDQNNAHKEQARAENAEKNRKAMNALADQIAALHIADVKATVAIETRNEQDLSKRLVDLRARFAEVASEAYTAQDKCPTCGRPFPAEDLKAAQDAWEAHRKERLDAINAEGRELSAKQKAAKKAASDASEELARLEKIQAEYEDAMAGLRIADLTPDMAGFDKLMAVLAERRTQIMYAMTAAKEEAQKRNETISSQMGARYQDLIEAKSAVAACMASRTARARVEELRAQQEAVVEALENAEAQVALCEEFIRTRVSMVEESINSNFDLVRWQLYREQINGGLEEICEATVNGVPYHDLNGAMRINAGLDIINACINATGKSAPIFVDNAESVTSLYQPSAQVIRLVVSEVDKQLRLQK